MAFKLIYTTLIVLGFTEIFAQGHIDHIKNQEYLKHRSTIDCHNPPDDNLSERICANLAFQKADSLLTLVYDSLLLKSKEHSIKKLDHRIIRLQKNWRLFRDQHC